MPMALIPLTRQRGRLKGVAIWPQLQQSQLEKFLLRQVRVLSLSSFVELTCQARIVLFQVEQQSLSAMLWQSILPCHQGRCGLNALEPLKIVH